MIRTICLAAALLAAACTRPTDDLEHRLDEALKGRRARDRRRRPHTRRPHDPPRRRSAAAAERLQGSRGPGRPRPCRTRTHAPLGSVRRRSRTARRQYVQPDARLAAARRRHGDARRPDPVQHFAERQHRLRPAARFRRRPRSRGGAPPRGGHRRIPYHGLRTHDAPRDGKPAPQHGPAVGRLRTLRPPAAGRTAPRGIRRTAPQRTGGGPDPERTSSVRDCPATSASATRPAPRTARPKACASPTNDAGYVLLPDGRSYCVAVFVTDSRETDGTNAAIAAEISRAAYECFTRNDP